MSQREVAEALGVSQSAASQQLKFARDLGAIHPDVLLEAAAPVLKTLAADRGYTRLAVFGSVARRQARPDSDIELIVEAPRDTSTFAFIGFEQLIEQVLGREVDLINYGGLKLRPDDEISASVMDRNGAKEYDDLNRNITSSTQSGDPLA